MAAAWADGRVLGLLPGEGGEGEDEDFVEGLFVRVELLAAVDKNLEAWLGLGDIRMRRLILRKFRYRLQRLQSRMWRAALVSDRTCFAYTTIQMPSQLLCLHGSRPSVENQVSCERCAARIISLSR